MTRTQYFIASIARTFGYVRRNYRLSEANSELHLLREAEAYLGMRVWQEIQPIEALATEYWSLRKLVKQADGLDLRITEVREQLDAAHETRSMLVSPSPDAEDPVLEEQHNQQQQMENLVQRRDELIQTARHLRKQYEALKTKREVLCADPSAHEHQPELDEINRQARRIQQEFAQIRNERQEVGVLLDQGREKLALIRQQIADARKGQVEKAKEEFQKISEINKELSRLRAEHGLLDVRIRQLYSEVGRHLSLNAAHDSHCRQAVRKHHGLVDVMHALRRSVAFNQNLAGRE